MRRGWGLKQQSDKRADENTARLRLTHAVRARDFHTCQAKDKVPEVHCNGPLDVHEIIPRSAWRAGYLVIDNCILICRAHHDWVGDYPDEAHERGLHGYSWERPT